MDAIHKIPTQKIWETCIDSSNLYCMGLRSRPCGCKLFTNSFLQPLHLSLDGLKLNKSWTKMQKTAQRTWKILQKVVLWAHVRQFQLWLDMALCLSNFLFRFVFSQIWLPWSWYASATELGWFLQVVWWMGFGLDQQLSLKLTTHSSRTTFVQSKGVAGFCGSGCPRLCHFRSLCTDYGGLEWSQRGKQNLECKDTHAPLSERIKEDNLYRNGLGLAGVGKTTWILSLFL